MKTAHHKSLISSSCSFNVFVSFDFSLWQLGFRYAITCVDL